MDNIHSFIFNGDVAATEAVLGEGVAVDSTILNGVTPLMLAAQEGHVEIVKTLLSKGANITAKTEAPQWLLDDNTHGDMAIHFAATRGQTLVIEILVAQGATINQPTNDGSTPLIDATIYGHIKTVLWLVEHGADISCIDRNGNTALSLAQGFNHRKIISILRKAGAK